MKQLLVLAFLFLGFCAMAQPPQGKAKEGNHYGEKINETGAVPAMELPALLSKKDTVHLKIKARVINSCSSKGCWLTLRVNDSTEAFVKMKDYAFFVPLDIQGKTVVMEGKAFIKVTSVEDLKHYAEDAKKPQSEIDAITKPEKQIRFLANGILVVKPD